MPGLAPGVRGREKTHKQGNGVCKGVSPCNPYAVTPAGLYMAKRYNVTHQITLGTPSDPNELAFDAKIDLPMLLSQRLQKNIRQGRVINIHSVKAHVEAPPSGNLDLGGAISGTMYHCPATKNSASAWRHAFATWRKQKSLIVNGIGPMVRYDDFEVAWNSDFVDSRTSTLLTTGMLDDQSESVCIYGASTEAEDVTLQDIYQSAQALPTTSKFPISNNVVKPSKFTAVFPEAQKTNFACSWSTIDAQTGHDAGAQIQSPVSYISDSASLCGVVRVFGHLLPENVIGTTQDDLEIRLTFTVSIGSSLVKTRYYTPKRKYTRKGGKSSARRTRRYRKRG